MQRGKARADSADSDERDVYSSSAKTTPLATLAHPARPDGSERLPERIELHRVHRPARGEPPPRQTYRMRKPSKHRRMRACQAYTHCKTSACPSTSQNPTSCAVDSWKIASRRLIVGAPLGHGEGYDVTMHLPTEREVRDATTRALIVVEFRYVSTRPLAMVPRRQWRPLC